MRFENLGYRDRQATLQRMHRCLNKGLFSEKLNTVMIDVENTVNSKGEANFGMFIKDHYGMGEKISFSHEFEKYIAKLRTQKEQVLALGQVMLHEMLHQYCYENNIDDNNHGGQWSIIAEKHGLHSVYDNGVYVEEWGLIDLGIILMNFRFRAKTM